MEQVALGTTGIMVSDLCLGGNVFGWSADAAQSHTVLDAFLDAGGTFVDTADVYSEWADGNRGGESETIIGDWMAARGNRDRVVVATKVAKLSTRSGLGATNIAAACEDSLRRLRTDHIDIYYAHHDDTETPLEETLTAFDALVKSGKVRCIAASNYTATRLGQALEVSRQLGLTSYAAVQPEYNAVSREHFEGPLQDLCRREGLAVLPYYAVARGLLTGKHTRALDVVSVRTEDIGETVDDRAWRVVDAVRHIAAGHGVSMAAVSLAWLRAQPGVTSPIASARTTDQLAELVQRVALTAEDLARITAA